MADEKSIDNSNPTCRCGHKHTQHNTIKSVNYSAGSCTVKDCLCIGFVIVSIKPEVKFNLNNN